MTTYHDKVLTNYYDLRDPVKALEESIGQLPDYRIQEVYDKEPEFWCVTFVRPDGEELEYTFQSDEYFPLLA